MERVQTNGQLQAAAEEIDTYEFPSSFNYSVFDDLAQTSSGVNQETNNSQSLPRSTLGTTSTNCLHYIQCFC